MQRIFIFTSNLLSFINTFININTKTEMDVFRLCYCHEESERKFSSGGIRTTSTNGCSGSVRVGHDRQRSAEIGLSTPNSAMRL